MEVPAIELNSDRQVKKFTFNEAENILLPIIRGCVDSNKKMAPAFLWGAPGIGKNSLVYELAKKLNCEVKLIRLNEVEPTDLRGIPFTQEKNKIKRTQWAIPENLPTKGRGILFFDELNTATPDVMNVALQLVFERQLELYTVPNNWYIMAAGNEASQGYIIDLPMALKNRFLHINMYPEVNEWLNWAQLNEINFYIISFISTNTEYLIKLPENLSEKTFPTPRSWHFLSDILNLFTIDKITEEIIEKYGTISIGKETTELFKNYVAFIKSTNIDMALDSPDVLNNINMANSETAYAVLQHITAYFINLFYLNNDVSAIKKKLQILISIFKFANSLGYRKFTNVYINKIMDIPRFRNIIYSSNEIKKEIDSFYNLSKYLK